MPVKLRTKRAARLAKEKARARLEQQEARKLDGLRRLRRAKRVQTEIIQKLIAAGIDARTSKPEVLKWVTWGTVMNLPDPDLNIMECLKSFTNRFGARPKVVVLDGEHHTVHMWHKKLLTYQDIDAIKRERSRQRA